MNQQEIDAVYEDFESPEEKKRRTKKQNKALHKALDEAAHEMHMKGITMQVALSKLKIGVRPTKDNVKEALLKPCMTALFPAVESTADLSTTQMQKLWDAFSDDFLQDRLGVYVEWPSDESMMGGER